MPGPKQTSSTKPDCLCWISCVTTCLSLTSLYTHFQSSQTEWCKPSPWPLLEAQGQWLPHVRIWSTSVVDMRTLLALKVQRPHTPRSSTFLPILLEEDTPSNIKSERKILKTFSSFHLEPLEPSQGLKGWVPGAGGGGNGQLVVFFCLFVFNVIIDLF